MGVIVNVSARSVLPYQIFVTVASRMCLEHVTLDHPVSVSLNACTDLQYSPRCVCILVAMDLCIQVHEYSSSREVPAEARCVCILVAMDLCTVVAERCRQGRGRGWGSTFMAVNRTGAGFPHTLSENRQVNPTPSAGRKENSLDWVQGGGESRTVSSGEEFGGTLSAAYK